MRDAPDGFTTLHSATRVPDDLAAAYGESIQEEASQAMHEVVRKYGRIYRDSVEGDGGR